MKKILKYFSDLRIKWRYKIGCRRAMRAVKKDNRTINSKRLREILKG